MKNLGYYNGKFDEIENMTIPMTDRVCYFGDGVYDATYSRNYKILDLDKHVDRFYNSARLLEINLEYSKEQMKELLYEMLSKMDSGNNFVYWQVTRGSGIRNHTFSADEKSNLWITISPKELVDINKKVKLITMDDTRFLHCNIKTLNLIPSVIASQRAKEKGCFETILHRNGRVTECAHSNVHILKNGTFITAPADNLILPGITRANLIEQCNKLNIPVKEIEYSLDQLMSADEIIVSSAGALCISANEVDGIAVGGKDEKTLNKLQQAMLENLYFQTDI